MRRFTFTFIAALTILILITGRTAYAGAGFALQCGNIVDPTQPEFEGQVTILVKDKVIERVIKGFVSPDGYELLDLGKETCLPGLIDLYTHLVMTTDRQLKAKLIDLSSAAKTLLALKNAQIMLHAGFTTIGIAADLDRDYGDIDLRNAISAGMFKGPRLLVAQHGLTATGGHRDLKELDSTVKSGVDNAREMVRREHKAGSDWIKVFITGGALREGEDPNIQYFTDEEIWAFADEAHRLGMRIFAHAHTDTGAIAASNAGYDYILHGAMLTDKAIKVMDKNGTWLVPNMYAIEFRAGLVKGPYSENTRRKMQQLMLSSSHALKSAYKTGVEMAFGGDPVFPHEGAQRELASREFASLVRHGVSERDAIAMATIKAATLLGLELEIGSLEVGKYADIVAVPGDPLKTIAVMEQVGFVMKSGDVIRNDF